MYIVHIASEVAPIAKVGGLADVMLGLSREQKSQGHEVDLIIPKYDCFAQAKPFSTIKKSPSYFQGAWHDNTIVSTPIEENLRVTCVDAHHAKRFFQRGAVYGFPDDIDRFTYFSRACLDYLKGLEKRPNIINL